MLALACATKPSGETTDPVNADPVGAEPVASQPTVFVEPPPEPPREPTRVEPEPSPPPSADVDATAREQAKLLFQDGLELFEAGDIAAAVAKFEQAYALVPLPAMLFNIARGREQLGDVAGACTSYRLAEADPQADARMREEAAKRIASLNCP
jgi:hypothetical protein